MNITVISASNRHDNKTIIFAKKCLQHLENVGAKAQLFSLESLPESLSIHDIYDHETNEFAQIVEKYIEPVDKLIIVAPEYNGSYPGILKTFIDGTPPRFFSGKKVALVGVSAGRSGNIRGLDHLNAVLNHMKAVVLPDRVYISRIDEILKQGIIEPETDELIRTCVTSLYSS